MIPGQVPAGPENYPYKLGQSTAGDPKKHAFLVLGRDEKRISTQSQVLNLFLKHRVKIASHFGYLDDSTHEFVLCLSCDLRNSDITADGLVVELRLLKSVRHARSISSENRLFDGFFFPITLLDNRVVVLDSQVTFLIEHQLGTAEEKAALVEVGRIYALDIVRQIRGKFPRNSPDRIIQENVNDYFKAAGMGRFSLLDSKEKSVQAIIRDPPMSERGEATGNHFIQGIVIGLIEAFQGREMRVMEDLFDLKTGRLFIALLDKDSEITTEKPDEVKAKALQEVEKVISSIEHRQSPINTNPIEVPALTNVSSPSLNQVLKTYENEGWVGGKIGIAPEPSESTPPIVVKYTQPPASQDKPIEQAKPEVKQETSIEQTKLETQKDTLGEQVKPEIAQETVSAKVEEPAKIAPVEVVKKPKKKATEEELTRAFKSSLSENDSVYFEESYLE